MGVRNNMNLKLEVGDRFKVIEARPVPHLESGTIYGVKAVLDENPYLEYQLEDVSGAKGERIVPVNEIDPLFEDRALLEKV